MIKLIRMSGGIVEDDLFVCKPGCVILSSTEQTDAGKNFHEAFNIDMNRPSYEQRAEFKSRLTYLSFKDKPTEAYEYNKKMAQEHQHLSIHSSTYIEFLIAGISIETSMELISHSEAKVGRLTSSKTKAMDETLYRIQGAPEEQLLQKKIHQRISKDKELF